MIDDDETDEAGLAKARWLIVADAIRDALENSDPEDSRTLSRHLELELGLRPIFNFWDSDYEFVPSGAWMSLLFDYAEADDEMLCFIVPRIERALATSPKRWLAYVHETGRACFDPVELSVCVAIAKRATESNSPEHNALNTLLHWCWECVLGQRPIPHVRQAPQRNYPTLILNIIRHVEKIELNWPSLGLAPVINDEIVVRWDEFERWVAFIKLVNTDTGKISPDVSLRLRSDGLWRVVNNRVT